tara:strand:+ start:413 stop:673 length:261 start_codon:yes stop_codon:yes gene_type:complete
MRKAVIVLTLNDGQETTIELESEQMFAAVFNEVVDAPPEEFDSFQQRKLSGRRCFVVGDFRPRAELTEFFTPDNMVPDKPEEYDAT